MLVTPTPLCLLDKMPLDEALFDADCEPVRTVDL